MDSEKPLQREFEKIDAVARRDREQAENYDNAISHSVEYQETRKLFNRVTEQDARALALLKSYRGKLASTIGDEKKPVFEKQPVGWEESEFLTGSQYVAVDLKLKFSS